MLPRLLSVAIFVISADVTLGSTCLADTDNPTQCNACRRGAGIANVSDGL
jgi:hypothetical protein